MKEELNEMESITDIFGDLVEVDSWDAVGRFDVNDDLYMDVYLDQDGYNIKITDYTKASDFLVASKLTALPYNFCSVGSTHQTGEYIIFVEVYLDPNTTYQKGKNPVKTRFRRVATNGKFFYIAFHAKHASPASIPPKYRRKSQASVTDKDKIHYLLNGIIS